MADYTEKAQHLRRCSPQTIRKPRVTCTIIWQPWAIKSSTPTALKHVFCNTIFIVSCSKIWQIMHQSITTHFTLYYQLCQPHNWFTTQLGTSCAFDSPGLARNEPTSGNQNKFHLPTLTFKEELQYTHYTLCFYEKNMYICTKQFIKI